MNLKEYIKNQLSKILEYYEPCYDCESIPPKYSNQLNENTFEISLNMKYHIEKELPLCESVFRVGSETYIDLYYEARKLIEQNIIELSGNDKWLLENTDIGKTGIYEDEIVALDVPYVINEAEFQGDEIAIYDGGEDGITSIYKRGNGYYGYNDEFDFEAQDRAELEKKLQNWGYKLLAGSLNEAEFKGEKVQLGKPKRGGPKKYYVFVKNPKTKRVKKVTFGYPGMSAKIGNKKLAQAFAKRHKCSEKKDRTKASYWSCNLPRYASLLGLGKPASRYW